MKAQQTILLNETEAAPSTIHVNGRCNYREEGEMRVVFANGIPLFHYAKADKAADQYAMVHLAESGLASQQEVASAFGCSRLTVLRAKKKFDQGGLSALVVQKTGPRSGSKIDGAKARRILVLKKKGLTNVAIASRLGLKEDAVRKALKRMGWSGPKAAEEMTLPLEPGPSEIALSQQSVSEQMVCAPEEQEESPILTRAEENESEEESIEDEAVVSYDTDPSNRVIDRAFARLGFLQDAAPLFRNGENIQGVGVLVAIPALIESGIMETARKVYGNLGASFYGLRTILLTLLLMALLRIKRPESLKEHSPVDLGRLLGLDRACEVKTLRRKLDCFAAKNKAELFGEELVKMLAPIVEEIKGLMGEDRRLCIVFDRGGWSPNLFQKLVKDGVDIVTYRKGKTDLIPEGSFFPMSEEIEGKKVEYKLHDRSVGLLDGKLWLRQVSRLNPSGHQTHIVTSRQDLSSVTIAYRMFERWRQENFFKYMSSEYALDALVDYGVEQDDMERLVPNPKRKEINRERAKIKAKRERLEQDYGLNALNNEESKRPTMRGFKISNSSVGRKIETLRQQEVELKALYERLPEKVPLKAALDNECAYRLKKEKKHLTDLLKMVAYQAESDLLGLVRIGYARSEDEGRTLIQSALNSSGDLEVTDNELRVTLNPLSSPHRTKVVRMLCEKLNAMNTIFPGSQKLRLVYDVKEHGHVT